MSHPRPAISRLHEDRPLFLEALRLTAAQSGFDTRLIEKDYYGTLLLDYFSAAVPQLVFKVGTCLAKVHAGFYRLSEDLDYSIPLPVSATRAIRRKAADPLKQALNQLPQSLPVFQLVEPCQGANLSTQYVATAGYASSTGGAGDTIKIEVGLREPMLLPEFAGGASTLLLDPVAETPVLRKLPVRCLSVLETYAEKCRAALSRAEVAIRDFFDLDYAAGRLGAGYHVRVSD